MEKLDLNVLNVKELDTAQLATITGGFNQSAYNAGVAVGEFLHRCVDDFAAVKTIWELIPK